jgi:hypothetical protein
LCARCRSTVHLLLLYAAAVDCSLLITATPDHRSTGKPWLLQPHWLVQPMGARLHMYGMPAGVVPYAHSSFTHNVTARETDHCNPSHSQDIRCPRSMEPRHSNGGTRHQWW